MVSEFKFNLNRINEALQNHLPSDGEIPSKPSNHRFTRTSLVRNSKFRHIFGSTGKKDESYEGLKILRMSHDGSHCAINPKFIAVLVESSGGGVFAVLPIQQSGRISNNYPKVCGHTGPVTDIKWDPFNDNVIVSSSDDTTIKVWTIPDGGLTTDLTEWRLCLQGHTKKVGHIAWHPTAKDILLSAGSDLKCIVWNLRDSGSCAKVICLHSDIIFSIAWNREGSLFATTSKDKQIRIIDPRQGVIVAQTEGHQGPKVSKVMFLDKNRLFTTGFSRLSERQFAIWDLNNLYRPLKMENLDTSSGILMPYYDHDTKVMFLAGKGDGSIRYYEIVDDPPYIYYLSQYLSSAPQCGLGLMPKKGVHVHRCEIVRFYKLHTVKDIVEPLSMIVPRKSDLFQEDLFPPTAGVYSSASAQEWLGGANNEPVLVSFMDLRNNLKLTAVSSKSVKIDPEDSEVKMRRSGNETQDSNRVDARAIPGSIRNIMRLSGTEFDFFLRNKQLETAKTNEPSEKSPSWSNDPSTNNSQTDCQRSSPTKLDNHNVSLLNNNYRYALNNVPRTEVELLKIFFTHTEEIKRLKNELIAKDCKIQELEQEVQSLRIAANSVNNKLID